MTKKKIAWVTDSTAYMTPELLAHPDVYVVPLSITFSDATFEDGVDLTANEMYKRINAEKVVPKTSQPSVGRFAELYEKLSEEYESAVSIHISGKLSGTINSSHSAGELAEFPVETVDSKSMSYAISHLILEGMKLAEQDWDYKKIAEMLRKEADTGNIYVLLGNLDQFYKGGRMSGASYLLGSILKIKPIITINKLGEFELFDKVRSEKKAVKRLLELLADARQKHEVKQVQIMHGNVIDKARELEAEIKALYPDVEILVGEISSTIAAHAGEGTVGLLWNNK